MASIVDVEGIGAKHGATLTAAGVRTTQALLAAGGTRKGRAALAKATKISDKRLLEWVNHVDLMRVRGVGSEYADLLEAAGVDTVVELRKRKAAALTARMAEVNATKKLVRQLPVESQVTRWIDHAKTLERAVSH